MFGPQDSLQAEADIRACPISVMYRTFSGGAVLFKTSLPTIIDRLPAALEVVVIVGEVDRSLFEGTLRQFEESTPFPLRRVAEPSYMDRHILQIYSKVKYIGSLSTVPDATGSPYYQYHRDVSARKAASRPQ